MNTALWAGHGIVVPVVLPLVAGALVLLLELAGSRRAAWLSLGSTAGVLAVAALLLAQAADGEVQAYLLGNWPAPWGIALALDRLAALMLVLTAAVALAALVYALAGEHRRGPHFHSLFQLQLVGLNGAFLTADLFNLFVFFEVLLAASYGLLLHGATRARLVASVHYVVFNLAGSALFLIAVGLLYGVAGTLNLADLARVLATLDPGRLALAQAALALLLVVFAVKAALLPLYFWLPATYAAAPAPVAALFAVLTKVGVYAIARCTTLLAGAHAPGRLEPVLPVLAGLALATLALAALGALAATRLRTLVAHLVVASAGTLLLAIGLGTPDALAAGLFYAVPSTLVVALWFLLADRIAAVRGAGDRLVAGLPERGWAVWGTCFLFAAVAVAGLPPLAGFLGKALLLQAAGSTPMAPWAVAFVLGSSLVTIVALARAGSALFWAPAAPLPPRSPPAAADPADTRGARAARALAVAGLLAGLVAAAAAAGPLARYAQAAAQQLHAPDAYIHAVLGARPVPPAYDVRREMRARGAAK